MIVAFFMGSAACRWRHGKNDTGIVGYRGASCQIAKLSTVLHKEVQSAD
jgi:hypothetical protein